MIFFGDIAWFYLSARDALLGSSFPILGITASLDWVRQGAVWTYLLIPALFFSRFNPISGQVLIFTLQSISAVLLYLLCRRLFGARAGLISLVLFTLNPYALVYFTLAYHTSALPLFTCIFIALIYKKRPFLSGVFLGFLYQLHLLTFIFWPFYLLVILKKKLSIMHSALGFILAITPFIISGREQTISAATWFIRRLIAGFSGVSLFSEAYVMVLLIPAIVIVSWILGRLPRMFGALIILILILISNYKFQISNYGSLLSSKITLSRQILSQSKASSPRLVISGPGSQFRSSSMPYEYLIWWLSRTTPPSAAHSSFLIHDAAQTFEVLK